MKKTFAIILALTSMNVFALSFNDLEGTYNVTSQVLPISNVITISANGDLTLVEGGTYTCKGKATIVDSLVKSEMICEDEAKFTQEVNFAGVTNFNKFTAEVYSSLFGGKFPLDFEKVVTAEFQVNCEIEGESVIATSTKYDFDEAFISNFMPTSSFFEGSTPELFVVQGSYSDGADTQELHLFVTKKLGLDSYSQRAKTILSQFLKPGAKVKTVRLAFPTDLYASFVYADVTLESGEVVKVAVAGMEVGVCQ